MKKLTQLSLHKASQSGQALLIVLLSMAAILTVVLSVASRSVTDISVTTSEEDALRAFSAAEAGVEKALLTGLGSSEYPIPGDTSVGFDATIDNAQAEGTDFIYPSLLKPGESATFWFVGKDQNGNLTCANGCLHQKPQIKTLCWGADPSQKPAVILTVYYDWTGSGVGNAVASGDYSNIKIARQAFDADTGRTSSNNFLGPTITGSKCQINGKTFQYKRININLSGDPNGGSGDLGIPNNCRNKEGCLIMAKVRVLYNDPT
ncbi:MAG TPA: hypothetical protein VJI69_07290 [Bacteroidia bacterium]|nr:hypothetical protein [Bacteroidia bacterium]